MTQVKICGIHTFENALTCAEAGADLLGFNFYAPSPRSITPGDARAVVAQLRAALGEACPVLVGVFVNMDAVQVADMLDTVGLDVAQISGDEPLDVLRALSGRAFRVIRPRSEAEALSLAREALRYAPEDRRLPALLVDAYHKELYGGTGESANVTVAHAVTHLSERVMLAGGLKPGNVAERVRAIQPWGVDVASGVESGQPGLKDINKVKNLVAAVREVDGTR